MEFGTRVIQETRSPHFEIELEFNVVAFELSTSSYQTRYSVEIPKNNIGLIHEDWREREREREESWGVVVRETTVWRGVVTET
jgi:hypothetical protein